MKLKPIEESVLKAIEELEIVDAHEHLPPEKVRLERGVDVFTLFSQYTKVDLLASGMPLEYWERIHDPTVSLEKRWEIFEPYLKNIRYGSYARPAFIAAKEFYGFNEINQKTYKAISERIFAANTPGIYERILRRKCRIRVALTVSRRTGYDLNLLIPINVMDVYTAVRSKKSVDEQGAKLGEEVRTLDDYLELIRKGLVKWKSEGSVGFQMWSSSRYSAPDRSQAVAVFDELMRKGDREIPEAKTIPLYSFLMEEMLDMATELELVVSVHTGMWGDFRVLDPQYMIPILSRHPKTRFEIHHMGIPYVRETAIIGKNFPNVWLNLCWCHIISPKISCLVMDELIDLVPINKIIAFGGDYEIPVEKVYGHLVMAREDVAQVLGNRIEESLLTENEAIEIAKKWFYDNPKDLWRLKI